jgi:preprotein translocase subunit YajC
MLSGCLQMGPLFLIMIVIFYFLVIRPQRKQQAEQTRFLERLKEGDRVITTSGIFGRIVGLEGTVVTLDVGDRTRIRFLRNQVARFQGDAEDAAARGKAKPAEVKGESKSEPAEVEAEPKPSEGRKKLAKGS